MRRNEEEMRGGEKTGKKVRRGGGTKNRRAGKTPGKSRRRDSSLRHRKLMPELRMTASGGTAQGRVAENALRGAGGGNGRAGEWFERLVELQARLRAANGCPWDREQTHESLRTYLVEETYEVLEALDSGDDAKIAGELGDLLLQIVFHAQLAREAGRFGIAEVIERIHTKLVRRHPHVFGEAEAKTAAQVLKNWEQLKKEERRAEGGAASDSERASVLDGVPRTMPALLEAYQLTRRAANVGFDWENIEGVLEKMMEETEELRARLKEKNTNAESVEAQRTQRGIEEEIGDLLFVAVNVARFLGADPEIALRKANRKFAGRFREMERRARQEGKLFSEMTIDQMEGLWKAAKEALARGRIAKQERKEKSQKKRD